jgi:autotransporter-associated beta strand protein
MNMTKMVGAALVAVAGTLAVRAGVDGTNVWIGAETGGSWSNVANWRAESPTGKTVAELMAGQAVYDLSGLASGAVVTNDYTGGNTVGTVTGGTYKTNELVIAGVIASGAAGDEWTVAHGSGANRFHLANPFTIDVTGGTLTWRAGTTTSNYPYQKPVKSGTGTFRFAEPTNGSSLSLWENVMTVSEGTLAFTNQSAKTFAFKLDGTGRLCAEGGTVRLGSVFTDDAVSTTPVAEAKAGAVLDLATSFNTYYPNYSGDFAGEGVISVSGGGSMQFKNGQKTSPFAFTGTYRANNATATFGTLGANAAASAEIASSGWLRFTSSQTLARLLGDGVDGGVSIPTDGALTVTGPGGTANDVFKGRLAGAGGFVKDGADYTLTLDGASDYAGATHVKAGTLALRRGFYRKGLCAMWRFDDADDFGHSTQPMGTLPLQVSAGDSSMMEIISDGVSGHAIRFKGDASDKAKGCKLRTTTVAPMNAVLPRSGQPFTVSFWMRPSATGCGAYPNFLHLDKLSSGSMSWGNGFYFGSVMRNSPSNPFHEFAFYTCGWGVKGKDTSATSVASVRFDDPQYLLDGAWHHVVGTYSNKVVTLYVDGVKRDSVTRSGDLYVADDAYLELGNYGADTNHKFAGDLDEIQILRGAWSDADVLAEYEAKKPCATAEDLLPTPFAHWTFDKKETVDGAAVFRDSGTRGLDLKCVATNSAGTGPACEAMTYPEDRGGGYVRTATMGDHLRLKDAAAFASAFPKGGSVTVSARLCNANGASTFMILGDGTDAGSVKFAFGGCPRVLSVAAGVWTSGNSVNYQFSDRGFPCYDRVPPEKDANWSTVTVTYDAAAKMIRYYFDGVLMYGPAKMTLTFNPVDVVFGAASLSGTTVSGYQTNVTMDDLAIWDVALDDNQVQAHVRALRFGMDATRPVLPAGSPVTVDAGATLRAEETFHRVGALSGAGTVEIAGTASFAATNWTSFAGTVKGAGELVMEGTERVPSSASVSADVRFDGIAVSADEAAATPFVTTTGRVTVPATGVFKVVGGRVATGRAYPIARGGSYSYPADASGWTFEPANDAARMRFRVRNGVLYATISGGLLVIIR